MNITIWRRTLLLGLSAALVACGGGGGSGGTPPSAPLSMQESQRYFPLTDGNVWVSQETDSVNGSVTAVFTRVNQRTGSKLIGNVIASVISVTDVPGGTVNESYLVKDSSGITSYGDNAPSGPLTAALGPYRLVNFPIQVGSSFQQINKINIDFGSDLDGDGRNERIDIVADVSVRSIEAVTVAAGTFQNCLRIDTNVTETLALSATGARITASGVESSWYALDVGLVKQTTVFSGNGQLEEMTEETVGYLVDGRASRLGIQVATTSPTITAGASTQLTVTLLDANNSPLITIPATWRSDNSVVATVDANGLATGNSTGTAILTPSVGGVSGQDVQLKVLVGFGQGVKYTAPATPFLYGNTAMGDLNGDGRNDVAVLEFSGTRILVCYQNSAGALSPSSVISTGLNLKGIAIKDINNDGLADLIVSGNSTTASSGFLGRVAVFRQDPVTHTFGAPQEIVLSSNNSGPLAAADLNGDSLPDIIVAGEGSGSNGILSLLFQGSGGALGPEVAYTSVPLYLDGEIHLADMNSDGRNDIVVQNDLKQLAIITQLSPGVFSSTPDFYTVQTSYWPFFRSFALGDLNGDGRIDIAVADPGNSGFLNIFHQNTGGTFSGPTLLTSDVQDEVDIYDLDGDGLNDIIVSAFGNVLRVFSQAADHTFSTPLTFSLPTSSSGGTPIHQALSLGDVTGDGLPDIVASWMPEGVFVLPRK